MVFLIGCRLILYMVDNNNHDQLISSIIIIGMIDMKKCGPRIKRTRTGKSLSRDNHINMRIRTIVEEGRKEGIRANFIR